MTFPIANSVDTRFISLQELTEAAKRFQTAHEEVSKSHIRIEGISESGNSNFKDLIRSLNATNRSLNGNSDGLDAYQNASGVRLAEDYSRDIQQAARARMEEWNTDLAHLEETTEVLIDLVRKALANFEPSRRLAHTLDICVNTLLKPGMPILALTPPGYEPTMVFAVCPNTGSIELSHPPDPKRSRVG